MKIPKEWQKRLRELCDKAEEDPKWFLYIDGYIDSLGRLLKPKDEVHKCSFDENSIKESIRDEVNKIKGSLNFPTGKVDINAKFSEAMYLIPEKIKTKLEELI